MQYGHSVCKINLYIAYLQFLRNILITASSGQGVVDPEIMKMADGVKMAAIVISIVPIIIIYPFVQKFFVKGVLLGSVKG